MMTAKKIEDMTKEGFQQMAYEKYKLDWMAAHGYTPLDFLGSVLTYAQDVAEGEPFDADEIYAGWEADLGFYGSIWACYEEFLGAEYQDCDYMKRLLTATEFSRWQKEA